MRKIIKQTLGVGIVLLGITLVVGGSILQLSSKDNNGGTKGFLWEVKKGNSTVYLFGSIHMAKKDFFPLNETIEKAYNESDYLAVEANVTQRDSAEILKNYMYYDGNDNVYNHLSSDGKLKLDSITKELKIEMSNYKKYKIWALDLALPGVIYKKTGYSDKYGIDMYFINKASNKKRILELEGTNMQARRLDSIPDKDAEKALLYHLRSGKSVDSDMNMMCQAYKAGDENAMGKIFDEGYKVLPRSFYEYTIIERNKYMTRQIEQYLSSKGTYFAVAGVAHFIGDDSIVRMLEEKGYKVSRIKE